MVGDVDDLQRMDRLQLVVDDAIDRGGSTRSYSGVDGVFVDDRAGDELSGIGRSHFATIPPFRLPSKRPHCARRRARQLRASCDELASVTMECFDTSCY